MDPLMMKVSPVSVLTTVGCGLIACEVVVVTTERSRCFLVVMAMVVVDAACSMLEVQNSNRLKVRIPSLYDVVLSYTMY